MDKEHRDFYQNLRIRIRNYLQSSEGKSNRFAEYLMLAPDMFHLLVKLTLDRDVLIRDKALLGATLLYYMSPLDLLPEGLLGPAGFLDDVAMAAYVVNSIISHTDIEVIRRHWAGEGDVLDKVRSILHRSEGMLGGGLWGSVRHWIGERGLRRRK